MKFVDVLFSDFVPDRGGMPWPDDPGYLVDAQHMRPTENGWMTSPDATLVTSAATTGGQTPAMVLHVGDKSNQKFLAGCVDTIIQSEDKGQTWNDVGGATYVATTWDAALFDVRMFFAPSGSPIQSKMTSAAAAAAFADATGMGALTAVTIGRVRDHLVAGNLNNSAGGATSRTIQWCSLGDPTDWPTPGSASALSAQAGSKILPQEYGLVRKVAGGEKFGMVFQERGITRMTYVGGDIQYDFDDLESGIGLQDCRPSAVLKVGTLFYFVNRDGLYVTDGYQVRCLSEHKVAASIFRGEPAWPDGTFNYTSSMAHDVRRNEILIKESGSIMVLCYNYVTGQFYYRTASGIGQICSGMVSTSSQSSTVYSLAQTGLKEYTAGATCALQTAYIELAAGRRCQLIGAHMLGYNYTEPTIAYKTSNDPASITVAQTGFTSLTAAERGLAHTARDNARFFAFRVTGAQSLGALMRGMRIYFEPGEAL